MSTNDIKTNAAGRYCSPELEIIDLNLEVGFCQSGTRKAYNDDLMEEDYVFEWSNNLK